MFLFLFLFGVVEVLCCSNLILCRNPLADRAWSSKSLELFRILILLDSLLILFRILCGTFSIIFGGWFELIIIYKGLLLGFFVRFVSSGIQIECYIWKGHNLQIPFTIDAKFKFSFKYWDELLSYSFYLWSVGISKTCQAVITVQTYFNFPVFFSQDVKNIYTY